MTIGLKKLVDYAGKCSTCEFEHTSPDDDPCDECLSNPAREGDESHTPINYKPREGVKHEHRT